MTDAQVLNSVQVQKEAKSRFGKLLDVLAGKKVNTIPHVSIDEIKILPHAENSLTQDLVACVLLRAKAPTGEHVRKDRHEMAVYEAFVRVVKEEIGNLADDHRSKLGSTLLRRKSQKIRLQIVEMSRAQLRTKEMVESVLLPLG